MTQRGWAWGVPRRLAAGVGLGVFLFCVARTGCAQNSFRWVTNYYAVTGATFPEIMDSVNHSRPARLAPPLVGLTEWNIRWHMSMVASEHGCRCSSFTTQTTLTNTLPFWQAPTNAAYHVRTAWMHYAGNLAIHEGGHSRIALAALAEVHKEVAAIKEAPDFHSLRNLINDTVERVLNRYRRMEVDYDTLTEHGAKQFTAIRREPPDP